MNNRELFTTSIGNRLLSLRELLTRQERLLSVGDTKLARLPDGGAKIRRFVAQLREALAAAKVREAVTPPAGKPVKATVATLKPRQPPVTLRAAAPALEVDSLASKVEANFAVADGELTGRHVEWCCRRRGPRMALGIDVRRTRLGRKGGPTSRARASTSCRGDPESFGGAAAGGCGGSL